MMRGIRALAALLSLSLLSLAGPGLTLPLAGGEPSSDIPDRREFPVNPDVNPCQDFFEYACSEVNSTFKLRPDRTRHIYSFDDSRERLLKARMDFLAGLSEMDDEQISDAVRDMKNVYTACMDPEARASEERRIVEGMVREITALETKEALRGWLASRIGTPEFSFVTMFVDNNLDDSDWDDLFLETRPLHFPARSFYEADDRKGKKEVRARLKAYRKLLARFFKTVGVTDPKGRARAAVDFELEVAKHHPTRTDLRDRFNQRDLVMTRQEALDAYPGLGLEALMKRIPERIVLRNRFKETFEFLDGALRDGGTALESIKSYLLFHAVHTYMDDAYPEFFQAAFDFEHEHLGGPEQRSERSERCTRIVMRRFEAEIDHELLPRVFPDFPKERLVRMIENVRATIRRGLQENDWLEPQSKEEALRKLDGANLQLFSPDRMEDWDFNPPADYSPTGHYANLRKLDQNRTDQMLAELSKGHNKTRWFWGPLTVNAAASPNDNRFNFPAGILAYPFFDSGKDVPDHVNLGAIGGVIGHELGHLFDDQGAKFDHNGAMREWMPEDDLEEFRKRAEPLVAQFDAAGHDGRRTLGENIGDLVGMTFAYRAAFPEGKGTTEAKRAFFLQWARAWCGVMTDAARERYLRTNSHSIQEARVNEQVKHQAGFHEAYQCKEGDPLYLPPEKRVRIW